jgi:uncharacterized protein YgbK (DUF1537 family)
MNPTSASQLECLLIADDLTGACDAAVHFAAWGRATAACLDLGSDAADLAGLDVVAISTDTRDAPPGKFRRMAAQAARQFADCRIRVLFKKIDSTLRGKAAVEIRTAAEAFGCEATVVTPAFPAMGRVVQAGHLRLVAAADFQSIHLPTYFCAQGVDCVHVCPGGVRKALDAGARYVSVDAASDGDLDDIVCEVLACGRKMLWAGSGGLAGALARVGRAAAPTPIARPAQAGAVLFCIGSKHAVTLEQQRYLVAESGAAVFSAGAGTAKLDSVGDALARAEQVVLRIPRGRVSAAKLRDLIVGKLKQAPPLLLSGGDTASAVCRALDVRRIELRGEIVPGIPWGLLRGGPLDGTPVATKSGGFGGPAALMAVADYFAGPRGLV